MLIQLDSKIIKDIYDYNQVAKTSFDHYYLRMNGEAASTLKHHTGEDRLSYTRTTLPIHEFFSHLELGADSVLFIDGIALYKACNKKTKIVSGFISDGVLNIITSNLDVLKKDSPWAEYNGTVTIPVARILDMSNCKKPFELARVDASLDDKFTDISDTIPVILSKRILDIKNNDLTIRVGKPLFPSLNKKSELYAHFHYIQDGLFKAHFRIEKEHVYNYHTFMAYNIFD